MQPLSPEAFEELVGQALDGIPDDLMALLDNVALLIEDEAPTGGPELLGLYEGTPLTERGNWYAGALPDRITLFKGPIERYCRTFDEVVHEVRVTAVHEIAHHFGIGDDRLHELGWA